MATLIDKLNLFENSANQTVAQFNKIFIGNELSTGNLEDEVVIGEIVGPEDVRILTVGNTKLEHSFTVTVQTMPGIERVSLDKTGRLAVQVHTSNENLENLILEEKEMEMEPIEYVLLQYFRGSQSPYHTQVEIAARLRKSARGIRGVLKRMEEKQIIKQKNDPTVHKILVTVNEEWL